MSRQMLPWALLGGALIACHVVSTERDVRVRELRVQLRRMRARMVRALGATRRARRERDEAKDNLQAAADWMRNPEAHGLAMLRLQDLAHLRARRDVADQADAEARKLRGALELIADGCERPERVAVQALERGEEVTAWDQN